MNLQTGTLGQIIVNMHHLIIFHREKCSLTYYYCYPWEMLKNRKGKLLGNLTEYREACPAFQIFAHCYCAARGLPTLTLL